MKPMQRHSRSSSSSSSLGIVSSPSSPSKKHKKFVFFILFIFFFLSLSSHKKEPSDSKKDARSKGATKVLSKGARDTSKARPRWLTGTLTRWQSVQSYVVAAVVVDSDPLFFLAAGWN